MKKIIALTLFLTACVSPVNANASSTRLTIAVTAGATTPATAYRVEERINNVWGLVAGQTAATVVPATPKTFDVISTTDTPTLSVIPIANGKDGTRSNACTVVLPGPDEVVTIQCIRTPAN